MPRILIIEDEPSIADTLIYALKTEGFASDWQQLGRQGLEAVQLAVYDLVILDVGLPDISGFEVCKCLRGFSEVPIIFLTARSEEIDRVVGLEIGADDYVCKPFSPREVVARVKAILKRAHVMTQASRDLAPFAMDEEQALIHYFNTELNLTHYEYVILKTMLAQPRRVFSRERLLDKLGDSGSLDRSIDSHIKSIRAKLRAVRPEHDPVKTHRGLGYSLQDI